MKLLDRLFPQPDYNLDNITCHTRVPYSDEAAIECSKLARIAVCIPAIGIDGYFSDQATADAFSARWSK